MIAGLTAMLLVLNVQSAGAQVINKPTVGTWYGNNPWYHPSTAYTGGNDTCAYGAPDTIIAKWSEEKISSLTLQVNITRIGATALTSGSTVKIYGSSDIGNNYYLLQTSTLTDTSATQAFKLTVNGNPCTHYMIVITIADSGASVKHQEYFLARREG